MKNLMSAERALKILAEGARQKTRWGPSYSMTRDLPDFEEAVLSLYQKGYIGLVNPEEVSKLRRQLAAANARVAKLAKGGRDDEESESA